MQAKIALRERDVGARYVHCLVSRFAHSTQREIITWRSRPRPARLQCAVKPHSTIHNLAARFRSYFYTVRPFAPVVTALQ